jgi:hypothetical protein
MAAEIVHEAFRQTDAVSDIPVQVRGCHLY